MKRLLAALTLVILVGAGCAPKTDVTTYENAQYGFAFDYPTNMEVRVRPDSVREVQYVGRDMDFFASLRVMREGEEKPLNLAFFYAAPDLSIDAFKEALEKSGPGIKVTATEEMTVNRLKITKVVSTTESGEEKSHYLFLRDGQTVIVSEFLYAHEEFLTVLETFRRK